MTSLPIAAQFLRSTADGLAGLATARLFENDANTLIDDFTAWKGHLRTQVLQLAAAIQASDQQGFADHIDWVRHSFAAREIPVEVLEAAVRSLLETTRESLPADAISAVEPHLHAALHRLQSPAPAPADLLDANRPPEALALAYVAALRSGDEPEATRLILNALDSEAFATTEIVDDVLAPALREAGRLWHSSEINVAEEHYVTQCTQRMLARVLDRAPKASPRGKTALLTTVTGDAHSLGILFVAAHFELNGWRTICLGADTPARDIADAADTFAAHVVLLGATLDTQIPTLIEAAQRIQMRLPGIPILAGGQALITSPYTPTQLGVQAITASGASAEQTASELVA